MLYLTHLLVYSGLIFICSAIGLVFNLNGNLFYFLIFFESCMLGLVLNFVFLSLFLDDPRCIVFGFIMFAVAAVESAVGLSLALIYQQSSGHIFYNYSIDV